MPLNYYFADNFFKKMTDLDSPRRNNDCYFYYYSTCTKGDSCTFRHEPSALGCETMCSFWKEGKCLNVHCNYRHMELRKNRKAIQCYWENQPGGCLKPHCPFLHQNAGQSATNDNTNTNANNENNTEAPENTEDESKSPKQNGIESTPSERNFRSQVDSLVVSFEEESDTESIPTKSPIKRPIRKPRVKTLEEIKLERIQEESAAYFAYSLDHPDNDSGEDLRRNLMRKRKRNLLDESQNLSKIIRSDNYNATETYSNPIDSSVFTKVNNGPENVTIKSKNQTSKDNKKSHSLHEIKNPGIKRNSKAEKKSLETIKVKTLEEIRAEKKRRMEEVQSKMDSNVLVSEISSTTKDEEENKKKEMAVVKPSPQKKKLKLFRFSSVDLKSVEDACRDNLEEKKRERPIEGTDSTERLQKLDSEDSKPVTALEADSGSESNPQKEKTNEDKLDEDQEEMLLLEGDLDYEDDGLMNEIDSILSK